MCILLRIIALLKSLPVFLFVLSLFVSVGIGVDVLIGAIVLVGWVGQIIFQLGIHEWVGLMPVFARFFFSRASTDGLDSLGMVYTSLLAGLPDTDPDTSG